MKHPLLIALLTSLSLAATLGSVNVKQLKTLQEEGVPVIDIRTPQEWKQTGIIKGAHQMMFFDAQGKDHAQEWMSNLAKITKDKSRPLIIYCAHANRTKAVGNWLVDKLGYTHVYELKGGIEYGWRDKGESTVNVE
jgi:rhodanese-related sulfurtransferase